MARNTAHTGTPSPAARCMVPVSLVANAAHRVRTPANSVSEVPPIRFTQGHSASARKTVSQFTLGLGAEEHRDQPVALPQGSCASRTKYSTGQRLRSSLAPIWKATNPSPSAVSRPSSSSARARTSAPGRASSRELPSVPESGGPAEDVADVEGTGPAVAARHLEKSRPGRGVGVEAELVHGKAHGLAAGRGSGRRRATGRPTDGVRFTVRSGKKVSSTVALEIRGVPHGQPASPGPSPDSSPAPGKANTASTPSMSVAAAAKFSRHTSPTRCPNPLYPEITGLGLDQVAEAGQVDDQNIHARISLIYEGRR